MPTQDRHIDYIRKRVYYSAMDMQGISDAGAGANAMQSLGDATQLFVELFAFGFSSLLMTTGGTLNGTVICPYDLDPKWPVGFKIFWTADQTAAAIASVTWTLLHKVFKKGIALAQPTGGLDTIIPIATKYVDSTGLQIATDTPGLLQTTGRGIRVPASLALNRSDIEDGAIFGFDIRPTSFVNLTSLWFLGLMMDYVPYACQGPGSLMDRPLSVSGRN